MQGCPLVSKIMKRAGVSPMGLFYEACKCVRPLVGLFMKRVAVYPSGFVYENAGLSRGI